MSFVSRALCPRVPIYARCPRPENYCPGLALGSVLDINSRTPITLQFGALFFSSTTCFVMLFLLSLSIRMQQSDSQSDLPCVGLIGQHLYGLIGMTTLLSLPTRMQHSNSQSDWPCVGLIGRHLHGLIGMTTSLSLSIRMHHSDSQSVLPCAGLIGHNLL